jgi:hypothetical protein
MSEEEKVFQVQLESLKDLFGVKLDNVCREMTDMHKTLKEHNGRLTLVEKAFEQAKGAGKMVSGVWGLIGGGIIAIIVTLFKGYLN